MRVPWASLSSLLCLCMGCGYQFAAAGAGLPESITSVCAPIFVNRTAEPGLELEMTSALRQRLLRAGRLSEGRCDARMEGEILAVSGAPTVLSSSGALASYRLQSLVRVRLLKGPRTISEVQVSAAEDYLPGGRLGDILQTETNRQSALHRLAGTLADEVYGRIASGW